MRADDTKDVPPSARGRDSIRITSRGAYTDSVIVLDLAHMPEGCSTWPAFWTVSQVGPNPKGGEIDIIEGLTATATRLVIHVNLSVIRRQSTELEYCFVTYHSWLHYEREPHSIWVRLSPFQYSIID